MRSTRVVFGALIVGALLPLASAQAQPHIGGAIVARNDVRGQTQGRTLQIAEGDRVFQNEQVLTGGDSLAKLVLLDDTNVALGPLSKLTLDRFVYELLDEQDELFLYRFSDRPVLVQDWTTSRDRLSRAMGRLVPDGGTATVDVTL